MKIGRVKTEFVVNVLRNLEQNLLWQYLNKSFVEFEGHFFRFKMGESTISKWHFRENSSLFLPLLLKVD